MKENKILNFLIPIIAVVIIFESVMLVSNLSGNSFQKVATVPAEKKAETTVIQQATAFELVFATANKEMKLGKSYPVELNLLSKGEYKVDAVSVYVKYDPKNFDISNLVSGSKLPKPAFIKDSSTKGLVIANYLISEPSGLKLQKDQIVSVLSFNIKPKKIGNFEFEISTGKEDKNSATMFIENATSKVLPFSSNKLNVNVLK